MKLDALQAALKQDSQSANVHVTNFNKTWRMSCGCYKLTAFSFYIHFASGMNGEDVNWAPHSEISEREAKAFLYGLGQNE